MIDGNDSKWVMVSADKYGSISSTADLKSGVDDINLKIYFASSSSFQRGKYIHAIQALEKNMLFSRCKF